MGFSFRSMFQPSLDPQSQGMGVTPSGEGWSGGDPALAAGGVGSNNQAPPLNAASPFGTVGPLFKTLSGETLQAAPVVQSSPFAVPSNNATNAPLTVGDVLPQLPPELAKVNGLAPDLPVAVSPQVLDAALRSGQAALPIFEIYRVCPALFLAPVSPQDPRLVPLPASKLPRLIASAQQQAMGGAPPPPVAQGASPFGEAQPAASPFGALPPAQQAAAPAAPGPMTTTLPPRRNGPPPPLADVPREAPSPLSLPGGLGAGGGGMPVFPTSPFTVGAASAPSPLPESPTASPFAVMQPTELQVPREVAPPVIDANSFVQPPAASFGAPPETGVTTPAATTSPFTAFAASVSPASAESAQAAPATVPPASEQGTSIQSPFTSLFGAKAVPTGQPAPNAPPRTAPTGGNLFGAGAQPTVGSPGSPKVRIGLAALLRGYSVAELGFDPVMVPSWIMTSLPASTVKQWSESPTPLVELGQLIDGIHDVGFRNVLNNAKREFQVRITPEQINAVQSGTAPPPTLPNLASVGVSAPTPAAAPVMRVEPPATASFPSPSPSPLASPFGTSPPPVDAATPSAQTPLFAQPGSTPKPQEPPAPSGAPAPLFAQPGASAAAAAMSFGASQAPTSPAPSPLTFQPAGMPSFPASAAPISNPFAQPAPSAEPPPVVAAPPPLPEPTPPPEVLAPSPEPEVEAPPLSSSPFRTPPKPSAQAEGFSSADLLGGAAAAHFAQVPPAPAIPVTNPFTGKEATTVVDVPDDSEARTPYKQPFTASPAEAPIPKRMTAASPSRPATRMGTPALGIQSHEANPDQILLRALLGSDEDLTPQKVVEMVCSLPGIAACVCLHGDHAITHAGAHKPQAREFQKQATELAHHLRSLAPLIGIDGAETFTLTSGDRLMTFCFPEGAILGVLHDAEPSLGLRDKITLIARELSRMLD